MDTETVAINRCEYINLIEDSTLLRALTNIMQQEIDSSSYPYESISAMAQVLGIDKKKPEVKE